MNLIGENREYFLPRVADHAAIIDEQTRQQLIGRSTGIAIQLPKQPRPIIQRRIRCDNLRRQEIEIEQYLSNLQPYEATP